MKKSEIAALIAQVEAASSLDDELLRQLTAAIRKVFPMVPEADAVTLDSVEQILHLVDIVLPGWTIQITGKARETDGHWRCSLRESRGSDEDEAIGLGSGAMVGLALLAALLHVALQKARD